MPKPSPVDYRHVVVGELARLSDLESFTVGGIPQQIQPWRAGQRVRAKLNGSHLSFRLGVGRVANPCTRKSYLIYGNRKKLASRVLMGPMRISK